MTIHIWQSRNTLLDWLDRKFLKNLSCLQVILCDRDETNNPYCKSVSRAGHGSGALIGLMVGVFILHNRKVEPWEKKLKIAAFILSGILVGSLIIWHLLGGPDWFTVMSTIGDLHCTNPTPLCAYEWSWFISFFSV